MMLYFGPSLIIFFCHKTVGYTIFLKIYIINLQWRASYIHFTACVKKLTFICRWRGWRKKALEESWSGPSTWTTSGALAEPENTRSSAPWNRNLKDTRSSWSSTDPSRTITPVDNTLLKIVSSILYYSV